MEDHPVSGARAPGKGAPSPDGRRAVEETPLGRNPLPLLMRIAAGWCAAWAAGLAWWANAAPAAPHGAARSTANGLAAAHAVFAYAFARAARDPAAERTAVYAALFLLGLRVAKATWEVLWVLEGTAAVVSLLDLIASLALFVGMVNALPAAFASGRRQR